MRNLLVKKQIYIDMKPLSQKLRKTGLSLLWGTTVWLFWRIVYPGHLQYHEQYQLFLFDMEYWKERIAIPGRLYKRIPGAVLLSYVDGCHYAGTLVHRAATPDMEISKKTRNTGSVLPVEFPTGNSRMALYV